MSIVRKFIWNNRKLDKEDLLSGLCNHSFNLIYNVSDRSKCNCPKGKDSWFHTYKCDSVSREDYSRWVSNLFTEILRYNDECEKRKERAEFWEGKFSVLRQENNKLRKQNKTKNPDTIYLLNLLADIREAAGDPEGKLMQDELVEHIRRLREKAEEYEKIQKTNKQTYKTKDKIKSNTTGSNLTGTVIQSYWHLDGETGQSPHMRHVVRWNTGAIEDLWEGEISLDNEVLNYYGGQEK